MKAFITILLFTVILSILSAADITNTYKTEQGLFSNSDIASREFITVFEEDFEDGADDWEHYDATSTDDWLECWHLSPAGSYSGNSWWMGDEDLGGYTDHRYLVLDTPEITLGDVNPELSFMFSLCCETTGGDPPYDAWDGANVRISLDDGNTWEVISGIPAYNGESFYSFGYEFDEGEGIPGWGSLTEWVNWTSATFDLSAYSGQNVKIRFAFASDSAYNTNDDEDMFGFRIDNIEITTSEGTFESDGDGAAGDIQMISGHGVAAVGDLWHIYEDSEAPSGTHAMGCFDDSSNSYLPNMDNYIITPEIYLPDDGSIFWNVYAQNSLGDEIWAPFCDYLQVEICRLIPGEGWTPWIPVYDDMTDSYFYTGNFEEWTLFSDVWGEWVTNISCYAGQCVKMRFGLHSDEIDEAVPGGFKIDDFCIVQEVFAGPAPENVVAMSNNLWQVELSWDRVDEGMLQWGYGYNCYAEGLAEGGTLYAAISFDPYDLTAYVESYISELEIYINDVPQWMTVYVWEGDMAGTELLSQQFTPEGESWNTITLNTPIEIESNTEYWIGYAVTHQQGQRPTGYDWGPAVIEKGDWFSIDGENWESITNSGTGYNWNIRAYVEGEGSRLPVLRESCQERVLTGYNIWWTTVSGEDYELIGTIDALDSPFYLDENPVAGMWNYYMVTALYDGQDGAQSDEAIAYVIDGDDNEFFYDDGSCEEGFNVGTARYMSVRFATSYPTPVVLSFVKIYIETMNTGTMVFRIYEDDAGYPGDRVAQFVAESGDLHAGWNIIEIPDDQICNFHDGSFFISIFEMANLAAIGKDNDTSGNSWITTGTELDWEELTDGNIMIRALVNFTPDAEPVEIIPSVIALNVYPNPFNPETTISFSTTYDADITELSIYNVKGQKVRTLINEILPEGEHSVIWDGRDGQNGQYISSGVYLIRLSSGDQNFSKKVMLIK